MQDTWLDVLGDGISQGFTLIIVVVIVALLLLYWMLNKGIEKKRRKVADYKQRVFDRWHDRERS